jgi:putative glycosyltransferase (TIGR04372 family)
MKVIGQISSRETIDFIGYQIQQIQQGGFAVLIGLFLYLPLCILAIPIVLSIRLIAPFFLVRFGDLFSSRIGHFAANTELYLCEIDAGINVPTQKYIDIFYMPHKPICNYQLAKMWKRKLLILPSWTLSPIDRVNRIIPGGKIHQVGYNTQHDRDVHNLLDQFPVHINFSNEEEKKGAAGLAAMGLPKGAKFICLTVRDSAYLAAHQPDRDHSYHDYRDSDIQNYVLAAESLARLGYYVIRMGVNVHEAMKCDTKGVIDYAANGMRSDFMDIYLGAKCEFCISVGTGFDAIPLIFRRPIVYVNMVPILYLFTFRSQFLGIVKHHFDIKTKKELTLSEILARGAGHCVRASDFEAKGIYLVENSPNEICDTVIEMVQRVEGTWKSSENDNALQKRFWGLFSIKAFDQHRAPLHGKIYSNFGTAYLRSNEWWLL